MYHSYVFTQTQFLAFFGSVVQITNQIMNNFTSNKLYFESQIYARKLFLIFIRYKFLKLWEALLPTYNSSKPKFDDRLRN